MYVKRVKLRVLVLLLMAILLCSVSPVSALVGSNGISAQMEPTEKAEAPSGSNSDLHGATCGSC